MSEFNVKVENVVSFATLGRTIPLDKLVNDFENSDYNPEKFPGLVYRITDPKAAALIFSSGKIVCTGAKSVDSSMDIIRRVVERTRKAGVSMPKKYDVRIENIVAASKIDASLNLEEIAFSIENSEYDPERFPGLVYRLNYPKAVLLLFRTGKIICTGTQNTEDIHKALGKLKDKLIEIGIDAKPG